MPQLRTRLELLKSLIALEEGELISAQLDHLRSHAEQLPAIETLIALLEQGRYAQSLEKLNQLLHATPGLVAANETELAACRLELKRLEMRLTEQLDRLNELQTDVEEFNHRHHAQLGELLTEILRWQQALREGELQLARMPLRRREACIRRKRRELEEELAAMQQALEAEQARLYAEQAYREAEQNHREAEQDAEQYQQELAEQQTKAELSEEDRQQLKLIYRKACKLAHPDLVPDAYKEQAHHMMVCLNQAKEQQDLPKLMELLAQLEEGNWGVQSDSLSSLDKIKTRIANLLAQLEKLEQEIAELQHSDVGQVLEQHGDLDLYFHEQATALEALLAQLDTQYREQQQQLAAAEQELLDIEQDAPLADDSPMSSWDVDVMPWEDEEDEGITTADQEADLAHAESDDYWERPF